MSAIMASLMKVNGSVTPLRDATRLVELPRQTEFPKLDGAAARQVNATNTAPGRLAVGRTVLLVCGGGELPEMATDVIDPAASYAVENVKRDRPNGRRRAGVGLGQWLERVLGSRAARL